MHVSELTARQQAMHQAAFLGGDERADNARRAIEFLDQVIPLRDASHAEVVSYAVEVPMRYAECFAILNDGRKVGLVDRRRFLGWSGGTLDRCYLFRKNLLHIELHTGAGDQAAQALPGNVNGIILAAATRTVSSGCATHGRDSGAEPRYIGIDGGLISMPGRRVGQLVT